MTKEIIFTVFNSFSLTVLIRVFLAGFLGGIIGYERESMNRPAGFRTHILVCRICSCNVYIPIYI